MSSDKDDTETTWRHLVASPECTLFGKDTQTSNIIPIDKNSLQDDLYQSCVHACHCMIYAWHEQRVLDLYPSNAVVLMQVRFDGHLGFPGGRVEEGEDHVTALGREMREEMGLDMSRHVAQEACHTVSYFNPAERLCMHFYTLEATLPELVEIERNALSAEGYGTEVMGTIRVPLYTMEDGYKGFPAFLNNAFIGSSKQQLLHALHHVQVMTTEQIAKALTAKPPVEEQVY